MNEYLTEQHLGNFLRELYPNFDIVTNRTVPNSRLRTRPDYRIEHTRIIVEFDGDRHYTTPKVILADNLKDSTYSAMGYQVIRIPYFVQLHQDVINNLFGINRTTFNHYSHGFIDNTAILPAAYCELGVQRFIGDLERFHYIREDILDSIRNKINQLDNILLVLPPSLQNLL